LKTSKYGTFFILCTYYHSICKHWIEQVILFMSHVKTFKLFIVLFHYLYMCCILRNRRIHIETLLGLFKINASYRNNSTLFRWNNSFRWEVTRSLMLTAGYLAGYWGARYSGRSTPGNGLQLIQTRQGQPNYYILQGSDTKRHCYAMGRELRLLLRFRGPLAKAWITAL